MLHNLCIIIINAFLCYLAVIVILAVDMMIRWYKIDKGLKGIAGFQKMENDGTFVFVAYLGHEQEAKEQGEALAEQYRTNVLIKD